MRSPRIAMLQMAAGELVRPIIASGVQMAILLPMTGLQVAILAEMGHMIMEAHIWRTRINHT